MNEVKDDLDSITKQDEPSRNLNDNLNKLLSKKQYLKSFFEFLKKNKVDFQILDIVLGDYFILHTKTLESEIYIVIVNKNNLNKLELEYETILSLEKKLNKDFYNNIRKFIIFLNPSMDTMNDIFINSKYIRLKHLQVNINNKRVDDSISTISLKKKLKSGLPLGIFNSKNKLNELTGKEWIKFTKSWFVHNPPSRNKVEILHPAKFPETLIEEFIKFFTKKGQIVVDPFLGSGSTALAAKNLSRSCIGFEISRKYAKIANSRVSQQKLDKWMGKKDDNLLYKIFNEDSSNIELIWKENNLPLADFCITSPPYWNQLKRNTLRQVERKDKGLDTKYSDDANDIGNIDDYLEFINSQKEIFDKVYNVIKNKGYLVVITNNVFYNGRIYYLAFDTAISLSDKWVPKDEKIWCQDDKTLLPLGINNAWVANRCHQYCLIFRKELKSNTD